MARQVDPSTISTFTIGFADPTFDESSAARRVASHFGARHHEKVLEGTEAVDLVKETANIADEPLGDYSILPTVLLSRFAKQHISVALSGDGGDELFYGYETFRADRWARLMDPLLGNWARRRLLPAVAGMIPVSDRNMGLDYKVDRMFRGMKYGRFERHLAWIGGFDPEGVIGSGGVLAPDVADCVADFRDNPYPDAARVLAGSEGLDPMKRLSLLYARLYLLDGVLVKVDRASMNTALEVRSPFLDTRLVELAFSLPAGMNLKDGTTKHLMRKILADRLPPDIVSLPKKGFGVPLAAWLRNELRPLIEQHLSTEALEKQGLFNPVAVRSLVDAHMSMKRNCRKELFNLLVFQLWHDHWL